MPKKKMRCRSGLRYNEKAGTYDQCMEEHYTEEHDKMTSSIRHKLPPSKFYSTKPALDATATLLRDLGPRFGAPVLHTFCSEVFWDPKIFPLGSQNRRHVQSSRHVLIERK